MKTKQNHLPRLLGLIVLVTLALTACSTAMPTSADIPATADAVNNEAITEDVIADDTESESVPAAASENTTPVSNANGLTDAEIAGLLFMREEEKLARDVYTAMYEMWGLPLFQNIARSEQAHMDSVVYLLDNFALDDPAANTGTGEFINADLQSLYNDLIAWGSQSLADALKVGAAIEEIDILDLQDNLATLNNPAVEQVYDNLLSGSENHLRAFTSTLTRQTGETYPPQYMSQAAYDAIIASSIQTGAGAGRGVGRRP